MAGIGHNSGDEPEALTSTAQRMLKITVDRIERLEEDRAAVLEDLKEVYAEAKANGFDVKVLRKVVRLRKMDPDKRYEEETLVDLYEHAIGGRSEAPPAEEDPDDVG